MLRAVKIYIQGEKIYDQNYGKSLDEDAFDGVLRAIMKDAFKYRVEDVKYHDFYKYRITYLAVADQELLFLFISDQSDKFENIEKEIARCKKEFVSMFSGILGHSIDPKTFTIFDPAVETIHKNLRPKISLVGFSGVGKTTITRLIRAEEIPTKHIPTITGDIATIKIGNLHFHLWDFAGQEQFSFLWNNFVHGSDAVLIITDSTLENVEKSKYFIELIKKEAPFAHQAVIGNKQDLPDAIPLADLERILNVKTYSMVATDPSNRDKMITIIADILEMSSEVSPLLRPLIERDRKVEAAEKALESGDFHQAIQIFLDVSDLCLTLGDDVVSQEFQEKAMKIQNILKNMEQIPTVVVEPQHENPAENSVTNTPEFVSESQELPPTPATNISPTTVPEIPPHASGKPPETASSSLDQLNMMVKGLTSSSMKPKPKIRPPQPPKPPVTPISEPIAIAKEIKTHIEAKIPPKLTPPLITSKFIQDQSELQSNQETKADISLFEDTSSTEDKKSQIERQILDLKLKLTDISKHIIDLDMENIMGNISNEEFEEKQKKLLNLENIVKQQIESLEKLLHN